MLNRLSSIITASAHDLSVQRAVRAQSTNKKPQRALNFAVQRVKAIRAEFRARQRKSGLKRIFWGHKSVKPPATNAKSRLNGRKIPFYNTKIIEKLPQITQRRIRQRYTIFERSADR